MRRGPLSHLGIEVASSAEVRAAMRRLGEAGLPLEITGQRTCCHATQDKVWVGGTGDQRWEIYTITDDEPDGDPHIEVRAPDGVSDPVGTRACC